MEDVRVHENDVVGPVACLALQLDPGRDQGIEAQRRWLEGHGHDHVAIDPDVAARRAVAEAGDPERVSTRLDALEAEGAVLAGEHGPVAFQLHRRQRNAERRAFLDHPTLHLDLGLAAAGRQKREGQRSHECASQVHTISASFPTRPGAP
jgi:hypothetical protein